MDINIFWQSVADFYARFSVEPQVNKSLRLLSEEVYEFTEALLTGSLENVEDEAGDVLFVLIGTLIATGVTEERFMQALERIKMKNDRKDHTTHVVADGKIRSKRKLGGF